MSTIERLRDSHTHSFSPVYPTRDSVVIVAAPFEVAPRYAMGIEIVDRDILQRGHSWQCLIELLNPSFMDLWYDGFGIKPSAFSILPELLAGPVYVVQHEVPKLG